MRITWNKLWPFVSMWIMATMFFVLPVHASSYDYYVPVTVTYNETSGTLCNFSVLAAINNSQLADYEYLDLDGLNSSVQEGATTRVHGVGTSYLGLFVPELGFGQSRGYRYLLEYSPASDDYPIIPGYGGYVTVDDDASLELGDTFSVNMSGFVDTTMGSYPVVEGITGNHTEVTASSYNATLPSDLEVGDLLIIWVAASYSGGSGDTTMTLDGWDLLYEPDGGAAEVHGCYSRVVDGGEGSFVTITYNKSLWTAYVCYHITGYSDFEVGTMVEDSDDSPDPPELSLSSDTASTLWIAAFHNRRDDGYVESYPGGYDSNQRNECSDETYGSGVGVSTKEANSSSEDPGTFTLDESVDWSANTIAVNSRKSLVSKEDGFITSITSDGTITSTINSTKSVSATGISSGVHTIETFADGTNMVIYVDDVEEDSVALSGNSLSDGSGNWEFMVGNSMPYADYIQIDVSGAQELWFQPVTMYSESNLADRSGSGNTGEIVWGENPSGVEVDIGGTLSAVDYVAGGEGDSTEISEVYPPPEDFTMHEGDAATGTGMPMEGIMTRMSDSLGWSLPVSYAVMILIFAVAVGFGAFVASGSPLGFTIGFGITAGVGGSMRDATGATVFPWWIAFIVVVIIGMGIYVWKRG